MIPVYRMEEHCEAYAIWHMAIDEGAIAPTGNLLLHVDHHDDMEFGGYDHDFTQPVTSGAEALAVVRSALGIADFIVPAIWEGIFDRMINFKRIFPAIKSSSTNVVCLQGTSILTYRPYLPITDSQDMPDRKVFEYHELSLVKPEPIEQPVVLDIDLDYFCWDNALTTGVPARIEIARADYEAFRSDPHHPMRILARRICFVEEQEGRYYLLIKDQGPPRKHTREERIRQRVGKFFAWLKENEIQPAMIDICRSRISGYCPADRWELVEELVLQGLEELYPIQLRDDLLERP